MSSGFKDLPPHAALFSGPDVWMESESIEQLARVAALPGCVRAEGMPDLHPGSGFPIGAVAATQGVVYPHLVGGDAGCGARAVVTDVERVSPDRLERRLREAFEVPLLAQANPASLFERAWFEGARGLAAVDGLPEGLRALAAREPVDALPESGSPERLCAGFESALGTIGGGNHFAEVSRVSSLVDDAAAATVGLRRNRVVALVHSGSRGLGAALARLWGTAALGDAEAPRYLGELAGACRFAQANRLILAYRVLAALGALRASAQSGSFDIVHNDVRREERDGASLWVHRKGAAPAPVGRLTVVLGSRGAPSWILRGLGPAGTLASVAHGAGRRMGRTEAREKVRARYRRSALGRYPATGGRTLCDDADLLYEEHPDAYKPIEPIIRALEAAALATRVAALTPIVTVKL